MELENGMNRNEASVEETQGAGSAYSGTNGAGGQKERGKCHEDRIIAIDDSGAFISYLYALEIRRA